MKLDKNDYFCKYTESAGDAGLLLETRIGRRFMVYGPDMYEWPCLESDEFNELFLLKEDDGWVYAGLRGPGDSQDIALSTHYKEYECTIEEMVLVG